MNIIYFGTDNNSRLVLEDLVNSENKVVLVITSEDSVRTRGNKKTPSVVKDYCIKNNINCIDKIPDHKQLETFNPDIIIVASFGKIIPMEILETPKYGALNLHPSLLPKYRGPSPVRTAIKNGEAPDGDLVALAGLRSKHNTYMSVPLIWTMMNQHTTVFAGGNFGITDSTNWLVLLIIIALGWHIVWQLYKKSGTVNGF